LTRQPRTVSKIEILDTNYQAKLLSIIPPENLPVELVPPHLPPHMPRSRGRGRGRTASAFVFVYELWKRRLGLRIASQRSASQRIASQRSAAHRIASHFVTLPCESYSANL
jgi:hypothetical protein